MLLQFNFRNYLSFRDEKILSAVASADKEHLDCLLKSGRNKVLPVLAIYGANASGKTNINNALTYAILFVRNSNNLQVNSGTGIQPFLFDESSKNAKSRFDFAFIYDDIKYEYGFELDSKNVYEEYLYEYKTSQPKRIFERTNINQYKYYSKDVEKELREIQSRNTDNKLFLATATTWNSKFTKNAYMWFSTEIDTYDYSNLENEFVKFLDRNNDESTQKFINTLLNNADFNISKYEFASKKIDLNDTNLPIKFNIDERNKKNHLGPTGIQWQMSTFHKVLVDGVEKEYPLPFHLESNGTKFFCSFGPIVKNALEIGKTIVFDEIDTGLHPLLVRYLISLFQDPAINTKGAQLIFNTHDLTQLDLSIFRRDQIYFVEKNNQTGVSDLYSLDEYSPRKTENIQKGYLQGRYGAIPIVGVENIKW